MADTVTQPQHTKTPCRNTNKRARGYAITINNPSEVDIAAFCNLGCEFIYQIESGQNNTTHLQGFLYFKNAVSFASVKKSLERAHIEVAKNKEACINYCKKEETRISGPFSNVPRWIETPQNRDTVTQPQQEKIKDVSYWLDIFTDALCKRLDEIGNRWDERMFGWLKYRDDHFPGE